MRCLLSRIFTLINGTRGNLCGGMSSSHVSLTLKVPQLGDDYESVSAPFWTLSTALAFGAWF